LTKLNVYQTLVERRKACRRCDELKNPADIDNGVYDSAEIGPYANWQGNLDAPLLVIGQDFADQSSFRNLRGWPGDDVGTNATLVELADAAGFNLQSPQHGQPDDVLFFTNAVLCMKPGSMGSHVPGQCSTRYASHFLRDTVELVNPRAVVTLGTRALRALAVAFALQNIGDLRSLVEKQPALVLPGGAALFPRYHPSRRTLTRRTRDQQLMDWRRIRAWLDLDQA
jgi:DNA polymerase